MHGGSALPFVKLEGTGNDFVLLDFRAGQRNASELTSLHDDAAALAAIAVRVADRRFGVGCDQLILLSDRAGESDVGVRFLNADGSEAEVCGNGLRAVGVYLAENDPGTRTDSYDVVTRAGRQRLARRNDGTWSVRMTVPEVASALERIEVPGQPPYAFVRVSMGNPHAVLFTEKTLTDAELEREGRAIETHALFPKRTNVEFVRVIDRNRVRVQVWERGAGATLSCGSGACAVAAAGIKQGLLNREVTVELPGGELRLAWPSDDAEIELAGPARFVFSGQFAR